MKQSELKQLAELAMKKHKAVVSNWREGRIKKVWQDEDGNLCVEYNSGHWWHYRNLDKPVPEWWQEVIELAELAFFIAGIGAGIAGYRILIEISLGRPIRTTCDYCKYNHFKK